ncbi:MAG TPA: lipase family protein [Iamia sp.]
MKRLVALLFIAVLVSGCSDDGGSDDSSGTAGTSSTTTEASAPSESEEPERFEGSVEDFYRVPDPLPDGAPGDVIRTMPVDAPDGEAGLRIMYLSTDAEDDVRAVTGLVYHPTGEAPEGGWPVLAWAHGTSGLAAPCAPSRNPAAPPAFGVEGVRVATDYIGLGPEGEIHPYLSAAAEGHAVIDGVAAARSLPEVGAGDEWVVAGVSQGGHAALVTGEQASERLPDAELLGTVAIAPGAELGSTYGDEIQIKIITTMVLVGVAAEDPSVKVEDYLDPEAAAAAQVIETGCVADVITALPALAAAPDYFTTDPRTTALGEEWLEQNDPGQVVSDAPLLVVQGGQDILVVPARTDALIERECGIGQVVDLLEVPEGDHDTVTGLAEDDIAAWVAARFAGEEPTTTCS